MAHSLNQVKETFKAPIIYKLCLFHFLSGAMVPRFQEYKYYFLLNIIEMSEFTYAILFIIGSLSMLCLVGLYHYLFERYSYRTGMAVGLLLTTITTFFDILFVLRINQWFGINDYVFIIVTNLLEDFVNMRFSNLP